MKKSIKQTSILLIITVLILFFASCRKLCVCTTTLTNTETGEVITTTDEFYIEPQEFCNEYEEALITCVEKSKLQ